MTVPSPKRRWFRFDLRGVFALTFVVCWFLAFAKWFGWAATITLAVALTLIAVAELLRPENFWARAAFEAMLVFVLLVLLVWNSLPAIR